MTVSSRTTLRPVDVSARLTASTPTGPLLITAGGRTIDVHVSTWGMMRRLGVRLRDTDQAWRRVSSDRLSSLLTAADLQMRVLLRGREIVRLGGGIRAGRIAAAFSVRGARVRPLGFLAALLTRRATVRRNSTPNPTL